MSIILKREDYEDLIRGEIISDFLVPKKARGKE
jgi:hypothetical protein